MEEHIDIKDRILAHFMEQEGGNISDPVLTEWLEEDEANRNTFYQYQRIWKESAYYMAMEEYDADLAWKKVNEVNQRQVRGNRQIKNVVYMLAGAAASFLLLSALSFMGLLGSQDNVFMRMVTEYGNRSEVKLPDGSVIRLNSGSDITYTYNTKKKVREVQFQGEGFFDVAKSEKPFVVKMANGLEIKVLGTSFNLQAYADDQAVQASLVEGSIEMSHKENHILMTAGDIAIFDSKTNKLTLTQNLLSHANGWLENKLYMEDMSLAEVCKCLERWYNVRITLSGGLGEEIRYNGVIKEESIVDVMDALSRLSNICYTVKGRNISITSKKQLCL